MKTTARMMLLAVVVVPFALTLVGCSGGDLPAGVPITVTGFVKALATSQGVPNITVSIRDKSGVTNADGFFTISQVPAIANNTVPITVTFPTPQVWQLNTSPASLLTAMFNQTDITNGTAALPDIYVVPYPGPQNQNLLSSVTGFVKTLADNTPVVNAKVTIEGQQGITDGTGAFTIHNVLGPQTGVPVTVDLSSATPANQVVVGSYTADAPASGVFNMGTINTVTNPPDGPGGF